MSDLRLYSERTGSYIDALYATLIVSDETQFFPELLEVFGKEAVVKFLDVFAGQTFVVPARDVLTAKIRDVTIWLEVSKRPAGASVADIAKEHGLTESQVRDKADSVSASLERAGIRCKSARSASDNSGR